MARYMMRKGVRKRVYLENEEDKICRVWSARRDMETCLEKCGNWKAKGVQKEQAKEVLGKKEEWLKELKNFRKGRGMLQRTAEEQDRRKKCKEIEEE